MSKIDRFFSGLNKISLFIASVSFLIMVGIGISEVILRYFFEASQTWAHEMMIILSNITIFIGFTSVVLSGKEISVTIFYDRVGSKGKQIMTCISHLACVFLAIRLLPNVYTVFTTQIHQSTLVMGVSRGYLSFPLLYCFIVLALYFTYQLVLSVREVTSTSTEIKKIHPYERGLTERGGN